MSKKWRKSVDKAANLQVGDTVKITRGPDAGNEGVVIENSGRGVIRLRLKEGGKEADYASNSLTFVKSFHDETLHPNEFEQAAQQQSKALTVDGDDSAGWFVVDTDTDKQLSPKFSSKFQAIREMDKIANEQRTAARNQRSLKSTTDYADLVTSQLGKDTAKYPKLKLLGRKFDVQQRHNGWCDDKGLLDWISPDTTIRPGDKVQMVGSAGGMTVNVVELHGKDALVERDGKRITVPLSQLRKSLRVGQRVKVLRRNKHWSEKSASVCVGDSVVANIDGKGKVCKVFDVAGTDARVTLKGGSWKRIKLGAILKSVEDTGIIVDLDGATITIDLDDGETITADPLDVLLEEEAEGELLGPFESEDDANTFATTLDDDVEIEPAPVPGVVPYV